MYDFFFSPFEYIFMKRALASCVGLALSCAPVGVFLILRRMTLMGDALSHSVLPGAAIGYVMSGLSLTAMGIGGILSGLCVAILSLLVTRLTHLKEDASFAGFFVISVGAGVLIISTQHNTIDLMHVLFGSALAVNKMSLLMIGGITTFTLFLLAIIYRPFVTECFDAQFFKSTGGKGWMHHGIFLFLVVLNLIAGFQALGTLLSLGMMILPALTARFWVRRLANVLILTGLIAFVSSFIGLIMAYHFNIPTGPAIVIMAGAFYILSLVGGIQGSVVTTLIKRAR